MESLVLPTCGCKRLRELEAEGIVTREVHPDSPIRVHYRLTEKGRALEDVVETIET